MNQTPDVLAQLRGLLPRRALSWSEVHSITERQAAALLDLLHVTGPPVPQSAIASVRGIQVDWQADWPSEATSFHTGQHWQIVVRSSDTRQRQRFSMAHEFGHILDDPVVDRLHSHLDPTAQHDREERLANYFAACMLMPRPWVKRDFYGGMQDPAKLARRYDVSNEAMATRLNELGLTKYANQAQTPRAHGPEAA